MKKGLALLLALTMVLQVGFCSVGFAEDSGETVKFIITKTDEQGVETKIECDGYAVITEEGSYVITPADETSKEALEGIYANPEDENADISITYAGDIEMEQGTAVYLDGKDVSAFLKGKVTGTNGIAAYDGSEVTLVGDLKAEETGAVVIEESTLDMTGDIVVESENGGLGVDNYIYYEEDEEFNKDKINIEGDVNVPNGTGVVLSGATEGTIDGNVTGTNGVILYDEASLEVTGDVNGGKALEDDDESGNAAILRDDSHLAVGGDINSKCDGANLYDDSTLAVNGDINAVNSGIITQNGVKENEETGESEDAPNNTVAVVQGDVNVTEGTAIFANGNAEIIVGGDVTSEKGTAIFAEPGIVTENSETGEYETKATDLKVSVGGNVEAYYDAINISGNGAEINVDGNVEAGHVEKTEYTNATRTEGTGEGMSIYGDENEANVGGNISSLGNGVYVSGDKNAVNVEGNIEAGHVVEYESKDYSYTAGSGDGISIYGDENEANVGGNISSLGDGVYISGDGNKVHVEGDINAGMMREYTYEDETGKYGSGEGITVYGTNEVTVDGDVTSYGNAVGVYNNNDDSKYETKTETETIDGKEYTVTTTTYTPSTNDEAVINVGGNVTSEDGNYAVRANGNHTIIVEGNVTNNNEDYGHAIYSTGGSTIIVEGDVTSKSYGINTGENSYAGYVQKTYTYVDENGNTVYDDEKYSFDVIEDANTSEVNVTGDVNAEKNAIIAGGESFVNVGGDVTSTNDVAIYANDKSVVTVGGDVSSEHSNAIWMNGDAFVTVEGDVHGGDYDWEVEEEEEEEEEELTEEERAAMEKRQAEIEELFEDVVTGSEVDGTIEIDTTLEGSSGQLIVKGTVDSQEERVPLVINLNITEDEQDEIKLPEDMPDIKVYELAANENGEYFDVNVNAYVERTYTEEDGSKTPYGRNMTLALTDDEREELQESLAKAIQYIIKVAENSHANVDLSGVTYDAQNDLMLAHEGDEIAVTVTPGNGYKIRGLDGGNAEVIKNADGTWTVIVKRGGGVTISALVARKYVIKKLNDEQMAAEEAAAEFSDVDITNGAEVNGVTVKAGDKAMDVMLATVKALAGKSNTMINIMGVNGLLNKTEQGVFNSLKLIEKMAVTFTALGMDDLVEEQITAGKLSLSQRAKNLRKLINDRMAAMTDEEKTAYMDQVKKSFQSEKTTVDGKEVELLTLELRVATLQSTEYTRYGFREGANGLELVKISTASVAPAK